MVENQTFCLSLNVVEGSSDRDGMPTFNYIKSYVIFLVFNTSFLSDLDCLEC